MNEAFLMKLAWGLINRRETLWVKVMRAKYSCTNETIPCVNRKLHYSNAWKGITTVWSQVKNNLIWRVRDGRHVKFWEDHWIPGIHCLHDFASTNLLQVDGQASMREFVNDEGNWDRNYLQHVLSSDFIELLTNVHCPDDELGMDSVAWHPVASGKFTIKSAYEVMHHLDVNGSNKLFEEIWKLIAPQRLKAFMWLVLNNALFTNLARWK